MEFPRRVVRWFAAGSAIAVLAPALLWSAPIDEAEAFIEDFQDRQGDVDRLLLDHRVFESADGYLRPNEYIREPLSSMEKELMAAENSERSKLYEWMAVQIGDGSTADGIGKERAERYLGRLKAGILRQDPETGEIFDSWPPVRRSAEQILNILFTELDAKEEDLFRDAKAKLGEP